MQLTVLGTGTCVPSLKRGSPANFLKIGGRNVLVDCGPGTTMQLERAKIDYKTIDIIFITHCHNDHMCDLNSIIHAMNFTPGFDRKKPLILVGAPGFRRVYETMFQPISKKPRPGTYKIIVKEIKGKTIFGHFSVECEKTIHSNTSIAYRFTEKGKSLVISGDCSFDRGIIELSKNCNVLLLECSFPNSAKNIVARVGHLIPDDCGRIAKEARVKNLVLTHFYPGFSETERLRDTKKIFKNTILAKDFMKIEI
jgi:ribonuclease BN (tRNA processing enzyme)